MHYELFHIPGPLQHLIRSFWYVAEEDTISEGKIFRTFADGTPGLIVQCMPEKCSLDKSGKKLPLAFLYGQGTAYSELEVNKSLCMMGMYFQPYSVKAIFGFDSHLITDSCIDLDELSKPLGFILSERLLHAFSITQQQCIITEFLVMLLDKNKTKASDHTKFALATIAGDKGITIKELHQALNISERSLERKFVQDIGITPKLYLRINRFQNSLMQIRKQNFNNLSDIAFDNHYSDHSHFLRDFKEFAGLSPSQYLKQSNELIDNFSLLK